MLSRTELAFSFLDPEKTGYITLKQFRMISKKLSQEEVKALMIKVEKKNIAGFFYLEKTSFQLDRDQDGKLSFKEFKIWFHHNTFTL